MKFVLNARRVLFSLNYREINWRSPKTWGVVAAIALAIFALGQSMRSDEIEAGDRMLRRVRVATVSELMGGASSLSGIAAITLVSEAKISAEVGGRIARVHASLGSRVAAGQILAEIENSSQRAAVLQAEGVFDAAKAALQKVRGGTREEQLAILQSSLDSQRATGVATLLSAYAAIDSAVVDTADQMFTGIETGRIQFVVNTSNQRLELELENERRDLSSVLTRERESSKSITKTSDLAREFSLTEAELRRTRTFMDTILNALAEAIPGDDIDANDIASYKSASTAARTSLTASLTAVASARSGLEIALKNLEQGVSGAQNEDVLAAEASVKQAQGAYNAALAGLEKTIIRSPISGTLNNFTVKLGDTVSQSQQIAIVSNNAALEGVLYVTEENRGRIFVGQRATFEDGSLGTITKIAPALDPVTRRIEVRIGLPSDTPLPNGQSIRVSLEKDPNAAALSGPMSIPITALRMEASRTVVFVVENGVVSAREITVGALSGDSVQVIDGVSYESEIVVDARGLKEGEEVEATDDGN